jgi:hypothetical protein
MSRQHRRPLADRVIEAAEAALAAQGYVSAIDVFLGIGWLDGGAPKRWQQGQLDCLEGAVQTSPVRLSEAMELFRAWATGKGLLASETDYVARTPQRQTLRFSRSGDAAIERMYRTRWVSPALPERKRERLVEKASRAPDLVVIQPLNEAWTCHRCGGTGALLMMEKPGPAVPALRRPRRPRIRAGRRCAAHAPRQGKKRAPCRGGALQPDATALRTARSSGRAAGLDAGATRTGRAEALKRVALG